MRNSWILLAGIFFAGCASAPLADKLPNTVLLGGAPACRDDGCRYTYSIPATDVATVAAFYGSKDWCWARFRSRHLTEQEKQTREAVTPDITSPDGLTSANIVHVRDSNESLIYFHTRESYHRAVCYKKISESPTPPPPPDGATKFDDD